MSVRTLCDFCGSTIDTDADEYHKLKVDGVEFDLCAGCYASSIILAERRRVRRHRVKKTGRQRRTKLAKALEREAEIISEPLTATTTYPQTTTATDDNDWMEPAREMFARKREAQ